jgi:hypothetical protein
MDIIQNLADGFPLKHTLLEKKNRNQLVTTTMLKMSQRSFPDGNMFPETPHTPRLSVCPEYSWKFSDNQNWRFGGLFSLKTRCAWGRRSEQSPNLGPPPQEKQNSLSRGQVSKALHLSSKSCWKGMDKIRLPIPGIYTWKKACLNGTNICLHETNAVLHFLNRASIHWMSHTRHLYIETADSFKPKTIKHRTKFSWKKNGTCFRLCSRLGDPTGNPNMLAITTMYIYIIMYIYIELYIYVCYIYVYVIYICIYVMYIYIIIYIYIGDMFL